MTLDSTALEWALARNFAALAGLGPADIVLEHRRGLGLVPGIVGRSSDSLWPRAWVLVRARVQDAAAGVGIMAGIGTRRR